MNIEKFNPKKDPKYIGYIFRFLKKKSKLREALGAYPRIVKFKDGFGWCIGWFIENGLGDFIGSRIYYGSEKVEIFCFVKTLKQRWLPKSNGTNTNVSEGCTLTEWHHKWIYANKQSRKCRHCGRWERKAVKTVKTVERRTLWECES